ncbi:MAG: tyrosine-type recombinase/integrase, partial [Tardiphaga sp.]
MLDVAEGRDPAAERKAERESGAFADLASQYVELHAKKHNKSWRQAERLVARHLLPRWGKLKASAVTRADVRAMMIRIDAPIVANQVLASASAIFSWAVNQEIIVVNPCKLVDRNPTKDRERVLSDAEVALLWPRLDHGLKLILLTGQRPGEVGAMEKDHVVDGWWQLPGKPKARGRGRRTLSESARALLESHLEEKSGNKSSALLKRLVAEFKLERVTPHDLRRTCLTTITRLGFGRDAMDRVANHRSGGVTDVYDRHSYAEEDARIMAAVARHILHVVEGTGTGKVVSLR